MPIAPRERLARLLDDSEIPAAFSTQVFAPADSLILTVQGVGRVNFPVRAAQAKCLIEQARQARFGRGEQTLTDLSVRDTWEITPDQVSLTGLDWDNILADVRDELGLPPRAKLTAELHSMLVYGKGQFFLPHQDSEKDDAMVATLVVTLPSRHTGGELVVQHNGATATYWPSASQLTFAAFYSDCRHEVKPVRSGHRITLTFNLLLHSQPQAPESAQPAADLARYLTEHFTTRAAMPYGNGDLDPPTKLVYLLDYEYTQRGLAWDRLKGEDARRAALLRAAAAEAGCETVLALTEVRETWGCVPRLDRRRSYGWDVPDEYPSVDDPDSYEITDLVDSAVTLSWWADPGGETGDSIALYVPGEQVCATTPSADLKPYQSEYEGYMGNYGNTMDRWYHRAAVVVWPRERGFAARAEASAAWALDELRARLDAGDLEEARAAAQSVAPFWNSADPALLEAALRVAADLDEAETAAMLLRPFRVEWLARPHATAMTALAEQYGQAWVGELLHEWIGTRDPWAYHPGLDRNGWVGSLPRLTNSLRQAGAAGAETARSLLTASWNWLDRDIRHWLGYAVVSMRRTRLESLAQPLAGLLAAADGDLLEAMARSLRDCDDDIVFCLVPALRATRRRRHLETIAHDCAKRLTALAARPARQEGDWSISWPAGCDCKLCGTLREFLRDPARQAFEWPLAKARRQHIHGRIDAAELPVQHQTWRFGSPYTLVLTKSDVLFEREQRERERAASDLAWLTENWPAE